MESILFDMVLAWPLTKEQSVPGLNEILPMYMEQEIAAANHVDDPNLNCQ